MIEQKQFQELYEKFKGKILDLDVKRDFDELYSISQDSDVLLVTVVGSLEAGKSTFFNSIVNEEQDISERNKGETTIRPIFVFPDKNFSFKSYEKLPDVNSVNINNVLDYFISGKDKYVKDELKIREKNDKTKLTEYVRDCQAKKNYLFASFSVDNKNSNFVKQLKDKDKKVVFVDMPGDDGIDAKEQFDPFYELILKRTDLVILVCSSTSDVGVSLGKYLDFIHTNNEKVPFILVLNYHDDQPTIPTKDDLSKQLEQFVSRLEKYKIRIEKKVVVNAVYAHTTKFNNPVDQSRQKVVDDAAKEFENFETELYKDFFTETTIKGIINDNKKIRFDCQVKELVNKLDAKISSIQTEENNFSSKVQKLELSQQELVEKLNKVEASFVISDIKQNFGTDAKYLTKNFRALVKAKLSERIIPLEINDFLNKQVDAYKGYLEEKVKTEWDKTIVVGKESVSSGVAECNKNNKKTVKEEGSKLELDASEAITDNFIKSSYKRKVLFSYNADDLEAALKNLRDRLFTYDSIGYKIQSICKGIKDSVVEKLRKELGIDGRDKLLMILKEIKDKLTGKA